MTWFFFKCSGSPKLSTYLLLLRPLLLHITSLMAAPVARTCAITLFVRHKHFPTAPGLSVLFSDTSGRTLTGVCWTGRHERTPELCTAPHRWHPNIAFAAGLRQTERKGMNSEQTCQLLLFFPQIGVTTRLPPGSKPCSVLRRHNRLSLKGIRHCYWCKGSWVRRSCRRPRSLVCRCSWSLTLAWNTRRSRRSLSLRKILFRESVVNETTK